MVQEIAIKNPSLLWGRLLWQSRLNTGLRQLLINPLDRRLRGGDEVGPIRPSAQ